MAQAQVQREDQSRALSEVARHPPEACLQSWTLGRDHVSARYQIRVTTSIIIHYLSWQGREVSAVNFQKRRFASSRPKSANNTSGRDSVIPKDMVGALLDVKTGFLTCYGQGSQVLDYA